MLELYTIAFFDFLALIFRMGSYMLHGLLSMSGFCLPGFSPWFGWFMGIGCDEARGGCECNGDKWF